METLVEKAVKTDTKSLDVSAGIPHKGDIVSNICTLESAEQVLLENGFDAKMKDGFLAINIGGPERPFTGAISLSPDSKQLLVNCQLGVLGDFSENQLAAMALAALDMNTYIQPFAFAIVSDADDAELDDEMKWPLVLTDSMPLGDLSAEELISSMDALIQALVSSRSVLEIGLGQ